MIDEIPIPSEQVKLFFMNLPFSKYIGLKLERIGNGQAVMTMPYQKNLIGDPKTGVLHGGVITTLLDSCCGAAVMTAGDKTGFISLINAGGDLVTLSLFEELSPGVKLIGINNKEAVFEKNGESLLVINFKNQISERSF